MYMNRLLLFILLLTTTQNAVAQTFIDYHNEGQEAYRHEKYREFLDSSFRADSSRPNHPVLLYNLAAAYSLNGFPDKACDALIKRSSFYAETEFLEDQDFRAFRSAPCFEKVLEQTEVYLEKVQSSAHAFTFPDSGAHPEGLLWVPGKDFFLTSDIRFGRIYITGEFGENTELLIDLGRSGYWSAMGLAYSDAYPGSFWVTTAAVNEFSGFDEELEGKSAVLQISLESGDLIRAFTPSDLNPHLFGDLFITETGRIYVSDSLEPVVFELVPQTGEFYPRFSDSRWWNLQGLVSSEESRTLYVADYVTGVYRIDQDTGRAEPLLKRNELLKGTDGLYYRENRLIFLQNGIHPKRISSVALNNDGSADPDSYVIHDQAVEYLKEPTLGTWKQGELYYIADSPWGFEESRDSSEYIGRPQVNIFSLNPYRW